MLAGLAAQTLTVSVIATVGAVALAAGTFVLILMAVSVAVTLTTRQWIKPARMVGGGVRRWSGFVLIAVGLWFVTLSTLSSPLIL